MEIQQFPFFPQERSAGNFRRFTDNFAGFPHVFLMGIPAAFFHGKELGKLFIHAGYGSFRLRIFCGAGAQDIDLFKFLQSVPEFFKPQGTEIAGIPSSQQSLWTQQEQLPLPPLLSPAYQLWLQE